MAMVKFSRPFDNQSTITEIVRTAYTYYMEDKHNVEFITLLAMLGDNPDIKKKAIRDYLEFMGGDQTGTVPDTKTIENDLKYLKGELNGRNV
jgi:hypothetical protein